MNRPERTISCSEGCGATIVERLVPVATFGGRNVDYWVSEWDGADCLNCRAAREARRKHAEDEKRTEENWSKLMEMLGGAEPAERCTLELATKTFSDQKKAALLIAKNFNALTDSVFFYGPVGTGKSHLAIGIGLDQVRRGYSVAYFTPRSLNREFRRYQLDADKEKKFLRSLCMVDVLIVDELGIGNATEFAQESLQEIIDGRRKNYRNGLVFTSNLNLDDLAKAFRSSRISDRLFGACQQVKVEGPSYRKKPKVKVTHDALAD